jgi:hypothetical protein
MLLERFLSNMVAAEIQDRVTPIIQTSTSGAKILRAQGVSADLIYIDAGHDYLEAYADLVSYLPLLAKGGVMIADDYSGFPGVRGAVERFAVEAGMMCEIVYGQAAVRHLVFRGLETLVVKVATTVVVVVDHQVTIVLKKPVALVDREKPECVGYEHISTSKEKVGNGKLTV